MVTGKGTAAESVTALGEGIVVYFDVRVGTWGGSLEDFQVEGL